MIFFEIGKILGPCLNKYLNKKFLYKYSSCLMLIKSQLNLFLILFRLDNEFESNRSLLLNSGLMLYLLEIRRNRNKFIIFLKSTLKNLK